MDPKKKKLFIIGAIVAAVILVYFYFIRNKAELPVQKPNAKQPGTTPIAAGTLASTLPEAEFPLKQGSRGLQVLYLQAALNLHNSANVSLDGIWGPATQTAISKYYPAFGGSVSWVNYRKIYSTYYDAINTYLKGKGLA